MSILIYCAIFVGGALLGSQCNRGIYRLAWYRRSIGPWSAPPDDAPSRRWFDRVPILGWIGLRRESPIHGAMYWVRPMLIELASAVGWVAMYWWAVENAGLMPESVRGVVPTSLLAAQYAAHVVLISLMVVATFIDFDEQTIPDAITVPGTLGGLLLVIAWPSTLPWILGTGSQLVPLRLTSPLSWSEWLNGPDGLWVGLACILGWSLAIWPKTVTLRRGWGKAVQYLLVSMLRTPFLKLLLAIAVLGAVAVVATWHFAPASWPALLSALVGMAFGGGLIWIVRIVGRVALGKEAMGFGDVTLMAMIGVYLGWQATLVIFFLAPFVAVFISLAQWMCTRRRDIAFGPYLCTGALIAIIWWSPIWENHARSVFAMGALLPQLLFFCTILLAGMLSLWRIVERALFGEAKAERK